VSGVLQMGIFRHLFVHAPASAEAMQIVKTVPVCVIFSLFSSNNV
jgi:hypothetical protein